MRARRKKVLKILFRLFCLVIIVACIFIFAINCSYFNIKSILVEGNKKLSDKFITQISGIQIGSNILKLNTGKTKELIMENEYVDKVTIKRVLPKKVLIRIKERVPIACIKTDNNIIYLDRKGYILKISDVVSNSAAMPFLSGLNYGGMALGKELRFKDRNGFKYCVKVLDLLQKYNFCSKIREINIDRLDNMVLKDFAGRKVLLYSEKDIKLKIESLCSIYNTPGALAGDEKGKIDFRKPDKPFFEAGEY